MAVAESERLVVDEEELEAAQWVELEYIRAALSGGLIQASGGGIGYGIGSHKGGLTLPQPSAIAHSLLAAACQASSDM